MTDHQTLFYFQHRIESDSLPPLILIHGAGGNHLNWPPQVRRLKEISVYAPDLSGHGKSDGNGHPTVAGYAGDVLAFLDELGIDQAILAGHSMGGAIAQQIALDAPERVAGLILIGTAPRMRVSPMLIENVMTNIDAVIEFVTTCGYGPTASEKIKQMGGQIMREMHPTVLRNDYLACDSFDIRSHIDQLTMPILVIGSAADQMVPEKIVRLFEAAPNIEFQWITCGHMVPIEAPIQTAEIMQIWLERFKHG